MIPLTLFLLACGAMYLGTIQAAFNALMRVSLRLLAEGSGRAPDLENYLQEPLLLFLPLRTLLGLIEGFVVLLLALMIGISTPGLVPAAGGLDGGLRRDLRISRAVSDRLERSRARARAAAAKLPDALPPAGAADPRTAAPSESFTQGADGAGIGQPRRSERRRRNHQRHVDERDRRLERARTSASS